MQDFVPGQRWINDAQLQLGLGSVLSTDFRTVTIVFLATGDSFVYSKESVPLTRVRFAPGDHIVTREGLEIEIQSIEESSGLITYSGCNQAGDVLSVPESELSNFVQLSRPSERLFNGQIDSSQWFELRYQTRRVQADLAGNPIHGLIGGRIDLIPHQLYIAHTVANRHAPRVLLADEVGLGKTIEAGMVVHQQLVTERAGRVLVVVPESLVHQWLVEMLRRFNLMFSIFDTERFEALTESDEEDATGDFENPFHTEQLVLCSLEFLSSSPEVFKNCRDAGWDILVVDEAHHLEWSEEDPGFEYQLIAQIAERSKGVLLLTATPEQLGKSSHYARLRLLDPQRFPDYGQFIEEEDSYQPIADIVEMLLGEDEVPGSAMKLLGAVLDGESADLTALTEPTIDSGLRRAARDRLVEVLLDRHGTGRILFRNTRNTVTGFPGREVIPTALDNPSEYREVLEVLGEGGLEEPDLLLYPELLFQAINDESPVDWTGIDPRPAYLLEKVTDLHPEKVLVITASANTAIDLAGFLKSRQGIDAAVFHEHMSLLERDRAAAWFADTNAGAQIMICSEIGSEGRNFQFAHHLVLFDLPLNPDLLEQRIGRLDRIGQTDTIRIHLCYIRDSAQEVMYQWYQQGLDALRNTCPTGYQVFGEVERDLVDCLHRPGQDHSQLIEKTNRLHHELMAALEQGRDRLLEYNSCRPAVAADLRARALQQDSETGIQQYMESVFDCFGVDYEIHSEGCFAINAGVHMALPFPSLPEDGMTVTYDRGTALVYEDVDYLTWDHPLVVGARDLVVTAEFGNTAVVAAPIPGVSRGTILLESIFLLEPASSEDLPASRYLPMTPFRVLIDQNGKRHDHNPSHRSTEDPGELLKPDMVKRIVKMKEKLLRNMVAASEKFANKLAPERLDSALNNATTAIEKEVDRLSALSRVNPNVREEEIDFYRLELSRVRKCIENTRVRLDALRVIIAT